MDLEKIYNFIDGMNLSKKLKKKKEVQIIPDYIKDEDLRYICTCSLSSNNWLCVVTTKKVLFLDKGIFNYVNKIEIPVENITRVSYKKYTMDGEVYICQGEMIAVLSSIDSKDLMRLVDAIRSVSINIENKNLKTDVIVKSNNDVKARSNNDVKAKLNNIDYVNNSNLSLEGRNEGTFLDSSDDGIYNKKDGIEDVLNKLLSKIEDQEKRIKVLESRLEEISSKEIK